MECPVRLAGSRTVSELFALVSLCHVLWPCNVHIWWHRITTCSSLLCACTTHREVVRTAATCRTVGVARRGVTFYLIYNGEATQEAESKRELRCDLWSCFPEIKRSRKLKVLWVLPSVPPRVYTLAYAPLPFSPLFPSNTKSGGVYANATKGR